MSSKSSSERGYIFEVCMNNLMKQAKICIQRSLVLCTANQFDFEIRIMAYRISRLFLLVWFNHRIFCLGFQFSDQGISQRRTTKPVQTGLEQMNRKRFFELVTPLLVATTFPGKSNALASYSANARNLERLNTGDFSGGSVYDNNPKSEAGRKRRAITGCKSPIAREEAALSSLGVTSLSEKECNQIVLGGDSEFMLQALRKLDCPSCPYGINSTRN